MIKSGSHAEHIRAGEGLVTEPFARLHTCVGVGLSVEGAHAGHDLRFHFRDFDTTGGVVWYVEVQVERAQLLELRLVKSDTLVVRQRDGYVASLTTAEILDVPGHTAFSLMEVGSVALFRDWDGRPRHVLVGRVDSGLHHVLEGRGRIVPRGSLRDAFARCVEENFCDAFRHSEKYLHLFNPELCRQTAVGLQVQINFVEFRPQPERRIYLQRQHVEIPLQLVLHDVALSHLGEQTDQLRVFQLRHVQRLITLRQPDVEI